MAAQTVRVDDHDIKVSKPDKELFPDDHVSKGDLIEHYRQVASAMVPHLVGRPLTLRRFPEGIGASGFFQKHAADYFPDWLHVVAVPHRDAGTVHYVVCDDAASLVYLANQATVEFHIWPSTVDALDRPDLMVIDIDPPGAVAAATLHSVARRVRDVYVDIGLTPFVQATGGRGYHVVAPLDRSAGYREVRDLALGVAERVAEAEPDLLTTALRKERRQGRIFLDVNRNGYGQTFAAPYTLRARPGAAVATPLDWSELGRSRPGRFTSAAISRRLAQKADPWAGLGEHAASPAAAAERLRA